MKTTTRNALWVAILGGSGLYCSAPAADEILPFLLEAERSSSQATPSLEVYVGSQGYALPNSMEILESGTIWSPLPEFRLRAGVAQQGITPCPAPLDSDCAWQLAEKQAEARGFTVGAEWRPVDGVLLEVNYRNAPALQSPVSPGTGTSASEGVAFSEDLSLTCRLDTHAWGDLELGLQLTRLQEASGLELTSADPQSRAALGLGWQIGSFRGDLTSRYTLPQEALGATGWNAFDFNIAWKTPWNARLSVGARNFLDERASPNSLNSNDFLGRVPYIRYQQDL